MKESFCNCEYCRPITRIEPKRGPLVAAFEPRHEWSEDRLPPKPNTYLHAGAGAEWPANTEQARITRQMLTEAVEAARREGYDAGNEAGYECGYDHGYSQGTDDGFSDGVADGYDEGYDEGFEDGFTQGSEFASGSFSAGYEAGYANRAADLPALIVDIEAHHWVEGWGRVS